MSTDTILNKFPGGSFLFAASGKDSPDASRPLPPPLGAGALSDLAINDDRPNGLLSQIVSGSNHGIDQKPKIRAPVFVQSIGDILRFSGQLFFTNKGS